MDLFGPCGSDIAVNGGTVGTLVLTGRFPSQVTTAGGTVTGEVALRNDGAGAVGGLSAVQPDVVVTHRGRIVATPLPRDDVAVMVELEPGGQHTYVASAGLVDCATGEALRPGGYHLHARIEVRAGDGRRHIAGGGPWPLEVT